MQTTDASGTLTQTLIRLTGVLLVFIAMAGCSSIHKQPATHSVQDDGIVIALHDYSQANQTPSPFKQVRAHFITEKPPALVFRVISDLPLTPSWFSYLQSLDTLEIYSPRSFLTRATLDSPWPFSDRDIISCVTTEFDAQRIIVRLKDCHDRYPPQDGTLRVTASDSQWIITKEKQKTRVEYKAWTDPGGNVPAFIYNALLTDTAQETLNKLKQLIQTKSLADYSY